jgi:two-component system heavy metal sensor histidine kinase CusS
MKSVLSITKRLTILSAFASCLILFLATGYLYLNLKRDLEKKDAKLLMEEVAELRALLGEHPHDWKEIQEDLLREESASSTLTKYYKRILDGNRRILISSSNMDEVFVESVFPVPEESVGYSNRWKKWQSNEGKVFLVTSVWVEPDKTVRKKFILQAAVDVTHDEALVTGYRYKVIIVLMLGLVPSWLLNVWVAKSGMRPLENMAEKARRITVSHLHERITSENWPRELGMLASAFDEMLTRLEESFARLSRFSVDVAHELRTPINNLMGEAQVALTKSRTSEEYRVVLESSLEEYSRLSRMIDNLLFLARSENNEIRPELVSFDVRKEIDNVVDFYDAVAKERGVAVSCEGTGTLQADLMMFRRLISNLLSNAVQYTKKDGTVTVSINAVNPKRLDIVVRDTGIGIDPAALPQIFNRFFRTQAARIQNPQGMGVGLYMVKSIMNLHSGTVDIQSDPGRGTTVTVSFPASA